MQMGNQPRFQGALEIGGSALHSKSVVDSTVAGATGGRGSQLSQSVSKVVVYRITKHTSFRLGELSAKCVFLKNLCRTGGAPHMEVCGNLPFSLKLVTVVFPCTLIVFLFECLKWGPSLGGIMLVRSAKSANSNSSRRAACVCQAHGQPCAFLTRADLTHGQHTRSCEAGVQVHSLIP